MLQAKGHHVYWFGYWFGYLLPLIAAYPENQNRNGAVGRGDLCQNRMLTGDAGKPYF